MKTISKICVVILAPALLLATLLSFLTTSGVLAETINGYIPRTSFQVKNVALKFGNDRSTIIATFPADSKTNPSAPVPGGTVTFKDDNATDNTYRYTPSTDYCRTGNGGGIWYSHSSGGVTATTLSAGPNQNFGNNTTAYVDIDYLPLTQTPDTSSLDNCTNTDPNAKAVSVSNSTVLNYQLAWLGEKKTELTVIGPIGGGNVSDYKGWVFKPTGFDNLLKDEEHPSSSCPNIAIVSGNNSLASIYLLSNTSIRSRGLDAYTFDALKQIIPSPNKCWVITINAELPTSTNVSPQYKISGKRGIPPSQGGDGSIGGSSAGSTTNSGTGAGENCQSNSSNVPGHDLAFVLCPVLDAAESASEALTGQIENLLAFSVQNSLKGSSAQLAWANIRDLASILLVIIMLVMVLSQAVSWGPFDAYTVRKILPKLVVAVIAMQLSWSILGYVFDLFNDLGRGIADLLYGPFGGSSGVTISKALDGVGVTPGQSVVVNWAAVVGVIALAKLSFITIVIAAWTVAVALITGYIVLVFRQIMLLACLIFAPLAFLAWIMPGTQRYWKLWYDNLSKLLLMFPLIMGLLAVGKIFAIITGGASGSNVVLKFIFVLIGFYGPFFLIPKTFKWGGTAMSLASQGISKAVQHGQGPIGNYLEGKRLRSNWHLGREARKAQLDREAKSRFGRSLNEGALGGRIGRLRTITNPLSRNEWRRAGRIAQTARAAREQELATQAQERLAPMLEQAATRDSAGEANPWRDIEQMARTGTAQEREAALTQMVKSRRRGELARYRADMGANTADWDRTFAKNGELFDIVDKTRADLSAPNLGTPPHLLAGGLGTETFASQHHSFFTEAEAGFAAMPAGVARDDALDAYVRNVEQTLRVNPQAFQGLLNGPGETAMDNILAMATPAGTTPRRLREIQQAVKAPPAAALPALAPVVTAGPTGTFSFGTTPIVPGDVFHTIHNEPEAATSARAAAFGGWDAYAGNPATVDQVVFIAQNKRGALRDAARQALQNRGITPPTP